MHNRSIFITGTDTGVGKTMVTAALAAALRGNGMRVGIMKPVETGCRCADGYLIPEDAIFLAGIADCVSPVPMMNPYALGAALAPALAAEQEGIIIDINLIAARYRELMGSHDVVLVEGAGGLLVPLIGSLTMHDLAIELGLPLLVVAQNRLGSINHTALTVRVAKEQSYVAGVVLNTTNEQQALVSNAEALRRWGGAPLIGEIPYMSVRQFQVFRSVGDALLPHLPMLC